jgi:hypothetical protein
MLGLGAALIAGALCADAADGPRVLFLHKSAGFEHSVVKVENGAPCHVEKLVRPLIEGMGGSLVSTKDGAIISEENLKNADVVMFYTTENLCDPAAKDGSAPMGAEGMNTLINWVQSGGGFMGFHCASDTWHRERNQFAPESPYLDMLGGEFRGHGKQFVGTLRVVDADHPTMAHVKDGWQVNDEWYLFTRFQDQSMHILALLDPGAERTLQDKYNVPNYPVIWCSAPGKGRVFYNAMGHREDVWENAEFQAMFSDAMTWTKGEGDADAAPNWAEAAPADLDPVSGAARVAEAVENNLPAK